MKLFPKFKGQVQRSCMMVCPRCETTLEGHNEKACERRMSRRYFFGVAAGAAAVLGLAEALPNKPFGGGKLQQFVVTGHYPSGLSLVRYNDRLADKIYVAAWDRAAAATLEIGDIVTFAGVGHYPSTYLSKY